MARAVRARVRPCGAARCVPALSPRAAERQSTEVDERDARAHPRPGRVSSVSALHHGCAVDGRAIWQQLARHASRSEGVLILDGTSFRSRGRIRSASRASTCGTLGKVANCQVAVTARCGRGRARGCWAPPVSAGDVAHTRPAAAAAHSGDGAVSGEMAPGAHAVAASARRGITVTAVLGDAEFGDNATLRRALHRAEAAVCVGRFVDLKVFRGDTARSTAPDPLVGPGRAADASCSWPRASRAVTAIAIAAAQPATRVAPRHVAQRNEPALARTLPGAPRHTRHTNGASDVWHPKSGCSASAISAIHAAHQVLPGRPAVDRLAEGARPVGAPTLGDRAAVSRAQRRTRARSLRRSLAAWLATARRADGARLCLVATERRAAARVCRLCRSRAR